MKQSLLRRLFGSRKKRFIVNQPEPPDKQAGSVVKAGQLTKPFMSLLGRYNYSTRVSNTTPIPRRSSVLFDLDVDRLKQYPASTLLRNLNTISPDASMAIWLILRMCGTTFTYEVKSPDGKDSPRGVNYLDEIIARLNDQSGGIRNLLTQAFKGVYVQGACSSEVVLEENLKDTKKLIMVEPSSITFFQETRGEGEMEEDVYVPKQLQQGTYVSLEKPGFYYIPLDPDIGDPYGVSPILSFLQTIFYYMRIIYDLNQVVHNQAWARLHVQVLEEVLRKNVSDSLARNDKKMAAYITTQLTAITGLYNSLEPDDTFVTTDATAISEVGGKNSGGIMSVKVLIDVMNRMLANSLKTMSTFLNQHQGKTETYSSVEWMIQVSGVNAIRTIVKSMFDNAFSFMLQVKGIPGRVSISFPPIPLHGIETEERMKYLKTRRVLMERDAGIIDHDHAANILYDIPLAEGEESAVQNKSTAIPTGRALVDAHRGGWFGVKDSRLKSLEKSYRQDLEKDFDNLTDKIVSELNSRAKTK